MAKRPSESLAVSRRLEFSPEPRQTFAPIMGFPCGSVRRPVKLPSAAFEDVAQNKANNATTGKREAAQSGWEKPLDRQRIPLAVKWCLRFRHVALGNTKPVRGFSR
jgi:hypothetical protein